MRFLIVTPFFNKNKNRSRPGFVKSVIEDLGYDVDVVTSDFCHLKKEKIRNESNNVINIKTIPYSNNRSLLRFVSHFILSVKMFFFITFNHKKYDRIYITAPFAITVLFSSFFVKGKIIVDIIDLWPLSLPFPKLKILSPFLYVWFILNKFSINRADKVISLSTSFLKDSDNDIENYIPLCAENRCQYIKPDIKDSIDIFYIGNIGELYDFDTLISAVNKCKHKNIRLHFIGDGNVKNKICNKMAELNIEYILYGIVDDEDEISSIVFKCDYGFNGFKNTNASLSYKSLTYMCRGLPVINSMKGDLWSYVAENDIGFNYNELDDVGLSNILDSINSDVISKHKKNTIKFFIENLDEKKVSIQIKKFLG